MDKQIGLSMADSFAEQTGFADASVTSIWLFLHISVLALHCLTESCEVLGKCLCDAVAGQRGVVLTGKDQGICNLMRM